LEWVSHNSGALFLPGLFRHVHRTARLLQGLAPDIILGASDALHIVLARFLANRLRIPYAVDLYDNFESFGLTRIPLLRTLYRQAIRDAEAVSCVSRGLESLVRKDYGARGIVETLESTVAGNDFTPLDRNACRQALGLPPSAMLIGTAGALDESRGISDLFHAFELLAPRQDRLHLVLAGSLGRRVRLPESSRVHYLGPLPHARIPQPYG